MKLVFVEYIKYILSVSWVPCIYYLQVSQSKSRLQVIFLAAGRDLAVKGDTPVVLLVDFGRFLEIAISDVSVGECEGVGDCVRVHVCVTACVRGGMEPEH